MQNGFGSRPGIFWWTAASALLMVVGGFGPWATALGITVSGTDGGDGWFLIIPGLLAGALLFRQVARPEARWPSIVILLLGALGALVAFVDLNDISSLGNTLLGDVVDTGWGLYLSTAASLSLVLAAVVTLIRKPYVAAPASMAHEAAEEPAALV
jgi:hypothetical protein